MRRSDPLAGSTTAGWRPPRDSRVPAAARSCGGGTEETAWVEAGATVAAGATIGREIEPVTDQRTATRPARAATTSRMLLSTSRRDLDPGMTTSHRPAGADDPSTLFIVVQGAGDDNRSRRPSDLPAVPDKRLHSSRLCGTAEQ